MNIIKKNIYEQPRCEVIEMLPQGVIATSGLDGDINVPFPDMGGETQW